MAEKEMGGNEPVGVLRGLCENEQRTCPLSTARIELLFHDLEAQIVFEVDADAGVLLLDRAPRALVPALLFFHTRSLPLPFALASPSSRLSLRCPFLPLNGIPESILGGISHLTHSERIASTGSYE